MSLDGTIALVTGSTDGVGRVVASRLAGSGARVLVHGRDGQKGERVVQEISESTGSDRLEYYNADFASLQEVRQLARDMLREHERLNLVINNAGIGSGPRGHQRRELSRDGYELRFAVNYLAPFLLTHLLLPAVLASAPARIVNVSSLGQHPIDFDDVMLREGYTGQRAYAQSKLAQIMFTIDLAQRLQGAEVVVNALHPATYMDTKMVRESRGSAMSTIDEGADAIMQLAASPDTAGVTGQFYDRTRPARASGQAYDEEARRRLWDLSMELTGLSASQQADAAAR